MLRQTLTRRTFGKALVGGVALTAASYSRVLGANDRIGVGFIGFGLIGKRHVLDFMAQPDIQGVALCDAHRGRVEEGRALVGEGCRGYADFRQLLDDKTIQAVVVSTPDHWHTLMAMMACTAGKDVYVEKPLTLFVREGQWLREVAARTKAVVQVGTQQRSGKHYAHARQLLREGAIGRVHSVRMQAHRNIMPGFGTPADCDPPPELDWNMFLGPAPMRPYNPLRGIYHFRWFWDTSGGQMTNLGQHSLDIVQWILGGELRTVSSMGGRFVLEDKGETPDTQDAIFEIQTPAGAVTATWSHREACSGPENVSYLDFHGTKGTLSLTRKGFTISPDKKIPPENRVPQFAGAHPVGGPQRVVVKGPDEFWAEPLQEKGDEKEQFTGHVRNFLDCVKSRATPVSDVESGHRVSTMCHLANISLRLKKQVTWDAAKESIVDDPQAAAMLVRPYRAPWDGVLNSLGVG